MTFPTAWKGYDQAKVRAFLLEASESFDGVARENERLRQEIARLDGMIRQYRELEATLNNTLIQAQKVSDDMRNHSQLEADRHRPRSQGTRRAADRGRAEPARRRATRDRRPENEAPRGRGGHRVDHRRAAQHTRVRARAAARPQGGAAPAPHAGRQLDCAVRTQRGPHDSVWRTSLTPVRDPVPGGRRRCRLPAEVFSA